MLHYLYATSSKTATSNIPSKFSNIFGLRSASETLLPIVWKSVAVASSLLSHITSKKTIPPTKNIGDPDMKATSERSLSSEAHENFAEAMVNSQKFISDDMIPSIAKQNANVRSQKGRLNEKGGVDPEQSFFEWLAGAEARPKGKEFLDNDEKKVEKSKKPLISKVIIFSFIIINFKLIIIVSSIYFISIPRHLMYRNLYYNVCLIMATFS